MIPPLRRWGASQLLGAWVAYWITLAVVVLWRPALAAWRISRLGENRSSASLGFGNGAFDIKMIADNATVYAGHAPYGIVFLWLLIPPLLIWIAWLVARPRPVGPGARRPAELAEGTPLAEPEVRARKQTEAERRFR